MGLLISRLVIRPFTTASMIYLPQSSFFNHSRKKKTLWKNRGANIYENSNQRINHGNSINMFSTSNSTPPTCLYTYSNPVSPTASPLILSFPFHRRTWLRSRTYALSTGSDGSDVLRKPVSRSPVKGTEISKEEEDGLASEGEVILEEDEWVDWDGKILEDTVPLVGFVRMILHSGKYRSGDRLSPEHEKTIIDRLLSNHPEYEKKIGCGIDYITVGYHPNFESSKCLFIVRKDGELVDFSYWKCIKGLIRKNYPLYADSFILRNFPRRRNDR